ncbi:MAG: OmpA family protein [Methylococcaceae bacterium]
MIDSNKTSGGLGPITLRSLSILLGCGLIACSKPYVVLLDNDDGTVGKVAIVTKQGTTVLDKPHEGAVIGGMTGKTFTVSEEEINEDFGSALSASPKKPISFYLYFEGGGTKLTESSSADVPKIIDEINKRPAPDISIIGHTDTVGDDRSNERLSLERAKAVAHLFKEAKLDADNVVVQSHGERNQLIPTPDDTDEPRNRRVEVTVR